MVTQTGRELSMRELFLLRAQARQRLELFLSGIWSWPMRGQFKHFQSGPERDLKRVMDIADDEEFHAEIKKMSKEDLSPFNEVVVSASLPIDDDRIPGFYTIYD